jgi:hypothetical protein
MKNGIHLPDIGVSFFIILGVVLCIPTLIAIIHHLHLPARRESPRDDFRGLFQMPVLSSPEQQGTGHS